jgi:hypothetical protein
MQAQETLLGCLQCLERLDKEGGLVPKLKEASLSVLRPNLSSTSPLPGENLPKTASKCLLENATEHFKID